MWDKQSHAEKAGAADLQVLSGLCEAKGVEPSVSGQGSVQPCWPLSVGQPESICTGQICFVTEILCCRLAQGSNQQELWKKMQDM